MFTPVAPRTVRWPPIGVFSRSASGHSSPPDPPRVLPTGARVCRPGFPPGSAVHLGKAHTPNAIERLHEEFKRRIKTQTVLPSAETAAMLFWALLASGQIVMRKVDGWQTLAEKPAPAVPLELAA